MAEDDRAAKPGTTLSLEAGKFSLSELKPSSAPDVYGSSVQAFVGSTDITLVFSRTVPVVLPNMPAESAVGGVSSPAVTVHLSPGTAKDLAVLLEGVLADFEKEWGKLETAFTRQRADAAKAAAAPVKQ